MTAGRPDGDGPEGSPPRRSAEESPPRRSAEESPPSRTAEGSPPRRTPGTISQRVGALLESRRPASVGGVGSGANWLHRGRLQHGLRAYGPWPLARRGTRPEVRFVILTTGRTGSELLVSLLDSHPEIMCDSEILGLRRVAPFGLIESRTAVAGLRGARAYGFKLLRSHLLLQGSGSGDDAGAVRQLTERGFRIILLEREDLLQQALSYVRASGGRYHHRRGDGVRFDRPTVDPVAVVATMYLIEEAATFARRALEGLPSVELGYERDLLDAAAQQRTADRVCDHLGLARHAVSSDLVKIAPRRTHELVANYDELATALASTRFAAYLDASERTWRDEMSRRGCGDRLMCPDAGRESQRGEQSTTNRSMSPMRSSASSSSTKRA